MEESSANVSVILKQVELLKATEKSTQGFQDTYRKIAGSWLTMAFAGIGVILSGEADRFVLPSLVLVIFMCWVAVVGITFCWVLDRLCYQVIKEAVWNELIKLEVTHIWLPQIHKYCQPVQKSGQKTFMSLSNVYATCVALFHFVSIVSGLLWATQHHFQGYCNLIWLSVILGILHVIGIIYVDRMMNQLAKRHFCLLNASG